MTEQAPKISVIIATYAPGDAVSRVVDSLDAQTLPQDEFEVIYVDDGSPDDTATRLREIAATRPNVSVHEIPNSGWPSKPRNLGIDNARGEYVLFMDHDDSLYPDALRRAYEYASENGSDVLSPKESRSNDVWWAEGALVDGNIPDAHADGGINRLIPMVPHKLYRRQMLLDHGIRFPERARALWEDQFINIEAYRHGKVVSVLADTPFYLWHASSTNTTHSFDPAREDFWERLADLMAFIETTLDTPEFHDAQVTMLAHQVRGRVLDRLVRLLVNADRETTDMAMGHAQALLERYTSDEVYASLKSTKHQAQVHLLRAGRADLLREFHETDLAATASVTATSATWEDGRLRLELDSRWEPKSPKKPFLEGHRDGVRLAVSRRLRKAIPPELLDVTDDVATPVLAVGFRSRTGHVTWAVPHELTGHRFGAVANGGLGVISTGTAFLDPDTVAVGAPMADNVWDCRYRTAWLGRVRKAGLQYSGPVRPALLGARPAVAYANTSHTLSVDLAQLLRTLIIDAKPAYGPAGSLDAFSAALTNVAVHGSATVDTDTVVAVPADLGEETTAERLEELASAGDLHLRIVTDGDGARLEGSAALEPGSYVLYARRKGTLHKTARNLLVDESRGVAFG